VKHDKNIKGVSMDMILITSIDRREWKKNTSCAHPTEWDKGTMMMMRSEHGYDTHHLHR
jgi:hypothetical protein